MFVYGDVVYAQTWQVLTLKTCMEPFSYASTAYLVASALVSVRLSCKNLGNLQKVFGQMVYRPPWQKIARTPMSVVASVLAVVGKRMQQLPTTLNLQCIVGRIQPIRVFSIYTLSDLDDLSNLIGSLSRTIQQYSPPRE